MSGGPENVDPQSYEYESSGFWTVFEVKCCRLSSQQWI